MANDLRSYAFLDVISLNCPLSLIFLLFQPSIISVRLFLCCLYTSRASVSVIFQVINHFAFPFFLLECSSWSFSFFSSPLPFYASSLPSPPPPAPYAFFFICFISLPLTFHCSHQALLLLLRSFYVIFFHPPPRPLIAPSSSFFRSQNLLEQAFSSIFSIDQSTDGSGNQTPIRMEHHYYPHHQMTPFLYVPSMS